MLRISDVDYLALIKAAEFDIKSEIYVSTWGGCGCSSYEIEDIDLAARSAVVTVLDKLNIEVVDL